ncbi:MAG: HAD-IIIA family hydrolase [Bacteroidales bacterium]
MSEDMFRPVKAMVFDYDGVLTNGTVILQTDGEALRTANVRDGYALQLAVKLGYHVAIISGGKSASMDRRFEALKITDYYLGVPDKEKVLTDYMKRLNISREELLYMGDDIPDYKAMLLSGVPCCPADAAPEIRNIARYVSPVKGGEGCVRDVIEQTLKSQNRWMTEDGFSW